MRPNCYTPLTKTKCFPGKYNKCYFRGTLSDVNCHATDGPSKIGPPDHLRQFFVLWVVARIIYACCNWSLFAIAAIPIQQPFT